MKIAVTSCSDPLDHPDQKVWASIALACPDHLILLGDQIYMDYGAGRNPGNGKPAQFSDLDFAAQMHQRYASQWRAMKDTGLWQVPGMKLHGIWDDHDFAWNNSYGAGSPDSLAQPKDQPVPATKQQISRHFFRLFFQHLREPVFPANELLTPDAVQQLHEDLALPVFFSEMLAPGNARGLVELAPDVRLLLTDGRSFRTSQRVPDTEKTLLGSAQADWLHGSIKPHVVNIIASGCTLDHHEGPLVLNKESWDFYKDYLQLKRFLETQAAAKVLVLSGDIHHTDVRDHHGPHMIEVVASGAARPLGGLGRPDKGNYVIFEISDSVIHVNSFEGEAPDHVFKRQATIDRVTWQVVP
jgi:alkaline phosphatase D